MRCRAGAHAWFAGAFWVPARASRVRDTRPQYFATTGPANHGDGRDSLGRYYSYVSPEWLEVIYASAGPWTTLSSDTNVIQSFDETPANMLNLVVRKA
jgi:hypothetical protein